MREKTTVRNQSNQIDVQMKLYAKLTKGDTEFELEKGYWMISNQRSGGYAWCRIESDGKFYTVTPKVYRNRFCFS